MLRLAEQLGAEVTTIPGQNVAAGHRALCDGQQFHPYRRRQADPVALARTDRRLAHLRSDPQCRRHQRPCHFGNRARATRRRRGTSRRRTSSGSSMIWPYLKAHGLRRRLARLRRPARPVSRRSQPRDRLPHRRCWHRRWLGGLWPALYACVASAFAFNYFLPRAALHADDPGSGKHRRARLLPRRRRHRQQSDGARAAPGGRRPLSGRGRRRTSTSSPRSSPAPARSTTCCGPPPSRSPRC